MRTSALLPPTQLRPSTGLPCSCDRNTQEVRTERLISAVCPTINPITGAHTSNRLAMKSPNMVDSLCMITSVAPSSFRNDLTDSLVPPTLLKKYPVCCNNTHTPKLITLAHLSLMILMVLIPQAAASCITLCPTPLLEPFWMRQSPVMIIVHQSS